jgi:hypothetical protein
MRAEEGDESIAELAKDAAKAEEKLDEVVDVGAGAAEHKPKHRKD